MRGRGLKHRHVASKGGWCEVAPHAGAISTLEICKSLPPVAPHAGAWIETTVKYKVGQKIYSRPSCGAWIETNTTMIYTHIILGRPSCGGVD